MNIEIVWLEPILLARHKKICFQDAQLGELDERPGVYFFSRRYGMNYAPFYIGETMNVRSRLKQHLKSKKIADVLRSINDGDLPEIAQGERYFHVGYFRAKPGQDAETCLRIVQRQLIEDAIAKGLTLINSQLTRLESHTLKFTGNKTGRSIYARTKQVKA